MFNRIKNYFELFFRTIIEEGWSGFSKKIYTFIKNRIIIAAQRPILKIRTQMSYPPDLSMRPLKDLPSVDLIIVTYNSQDCISRCIESIQNSQYPADKISLFIVDNNSSDNTINVIKSIQFIIRTTIIESKTNKGFGAANNLGFKNTSNRYILFLNPDTELNNDTLQRLVKTALESENRGFCAWEARQQPYEHPKLYDPVTLETEWVSGACFLVLREAFEKVNGFDENIFLYAEDVDLSWRLRGCGYRLKYAPAAVINHFTYANENVVKPVQFFNSIFSNGILRFKFGGFKDTIFYYLLVLMVLVRPPKIKGVSLTLVKSIFAMMPNIRKALVWRAKYKRQFSDNVHRFSGWNYEIRRKGDFYITKSCKEKPTVTIIIRTVQRPYFLRDALQSVRNQTYRPIEIIVVEDGAAGSENIISEFNDLNIEYIPTGNHVGRSRAGNRGLAKASGKYINFLDDDDLLFADHVEVLAGELENDRLQRKAAYSTGLEVPTKIISTNPFKYVENCYYLRYDKPFNCAALKKSNYIPINCMMFNRELFIKEGGFDERLDFLEDWDLWLRYMQYTDFIYVQKTTCLYRIPASKDAVKSRNEQLIKARGILKIKYNEDSLSF